MIQLPPALVAAAPCTNVKLTIKAQKLLDKDTFSKSDPMCVVFRKDGRSQDWTEIGRTECIKNCLNPEWLKTFTLEYYFEEKQRMKFEIYDIDNASAILDKQDFLGLLECDLAEIVSVGYFTKPLQGPKRDSGSITIVSDELDEGSRDCLAFDVRAEKVERKDFFGLVKSDPYLNIYRLNDNGSRTLIHRTEYKRKTRKPSWKTFELNLKTLCLGDVSRSFLVECWDNDDETEQVMNSRKILKSDANNLSLSNHTSTADYIGSAEIRVEDLLSGQVRVDLINYIRRERKRGGSVKPSGILTLNTRTIRKYTFLDYISGGTQLDFAVAVDFTASNGKVHSPSSLHYIGNQFPNQYEIAIRSVLEVCQFYNNTKQFDAFGFGAIIPPNTSVTPVFDLANPKTVIENPTVVGVEGVLRAYRSTLERVQLYGPTNFAPILEQLARRMAVKRDDKGTRYQILLIITDGAISDLQKTKKAIMDCLHLPLSIIIVGVGNAEFGAMDELDGDDVHLSVNGRVADRDIVQFVPMRAFQQNNNLSSDVLMAMLAKEVLAEVPTQLTSYMNTYSIPPLPPGSKPPPPVVSSGNPPPNPIGFQNNLQQSVPFYPEVSSLSSSIPSAPPDDLLPYPSSSMSSQQQPWVQQHHY